LIDDARAEVGRRRWLANSMLASGVLLCVMLYVWPPARYSFYPVCPFHTFLHVECPGCGATRALAALLRGHLVEALRLNAFFVVALPFGLAGAVECYRRAVRVGEFRWPVVPRAAMCAGVVAAVGFMVMRNVVR
jgi:hypothetical protein